MFFSKYPAGAIILLVSIFPFIRRKILMIVGGIRADLEWSEAE